LNRVKSCLLASSFRARAAAWSQVTPDGVASFSEPRAVYLAGDEEGWDGGGVEKVFPMPEE